MTVNTKAAPSRSLAFSSFEQVLAELDRIDAAGESAATTGNWSIGEICDHCARFIACACDGFAFNAPAPVRWLFRAMLLKKAMGPDPLPSGFKLPSRAEDLHPEPGISDTGGIDHLRKELKRVVAGKQMTHPSPLFGRLTHEQWTTIQCKHCAMHMGFIFPDGRPEALSDA